MHISCEEITYCLACFVSVNSIYTKLSSLTMNARFGYKVENKIFQDFLDLSVEKGMWEGGRSLWRKEKRTKLEQTEILLRLLTEVCKGLSRRRLGFPATWYFYTICVTLDRNLFSLDYRHYVQLFTWPQLGKISPWSQLELTIIKTKVSGISLALLAEVWKADVPYQPRDMCKLTHAQKCCVCKTANALLLSELRNFGADKGASSVN
jgi:hypothetical protein